MSTLRTMMLLLSLLTLTLCCVNCKTRTILLPSDRVIKYDGTNYLVPPVVMMEILHRLNTLTVTNAINNP